jgi:surface antigen/LysM repeat protein
VPKASTIAIYASIFAVIVAVVAIGYRPPQETSAVANAASTNITTPATDPGSIDQVVATSVAANLAETTNLSVAQNTAEFAASTQIQSELSQPDNSVITKPQILQPTAENRATTSYTVKAGDTVTSVAAQYNLSTTTIKWANNLTGDALTVGSNLVILPIDGVLYTVKSGDTLQSISTKYGVDQTRVVLYNDLDVSGITTGQKIILPGGSLPTNEQPGYVAPVTTFVTGFNSGFGGNTWHIANGTPGYAGNTYAYGNCTRYAYDRRVELGLPVQANWGNAYSWASAAAAAGLTVNHSPSIGAVMQSSDHVAIVENILPNGDLSISEMNAYVSGGGWNVVSGRIVQAAYVSQYLYIH